MSGGIGNMLFFDLFSSWKCARSKGFSSEPPSSGLCVVRLRACWCVGVGVGVMLTPTPFQLTPTPFPVCYVQNTIRVKWCQCTRGRFDCSSVPTTPWPLDDVLHPRRHKPLIKCELGVRAVTPPHNNPSSCPPSCPTLAQAHPQSTNSSTMDATFTPTKLQPGNLATDRTAFRSPPMAHSLSSSRIALNDFCKPTPVAPSWWWLLLGGCPLPCWWTSRNFPPTYWCLFRHPNTQHWSKPGMIVLRRLACHPHQTRTWLFCKPTKATRVGSPNWTKFRAFLPLDTIYHSGFHSIEVTPTALRYNSLRFTATFTWSERFCHTNVDTSWQCVNNSTTFLDLGDQHTFFLRHFAKTTPHTRLATSNWLHFSLSHIIRRRMRGCSTHTWHLQGDSPRLVLTWMLNSVCFGTNLHGLHTRIQWSLHGTLDGVLTLHTIISWPCSCPCPSRHLLLEVSILGALGIQLTCVVPSRTRTHACDSLGKLWHTHREPCCTRNKSGILSQWCGASHQVAVEGDFHLLDHAPALYPHVSGIAICPYRHQRPSRPHDAHSDITGNRGHSQKHVSHCSMDDWARTPRAPDLCHGTATASEIPTPTRTCIGCQLKRRSTQHRRTCRHAHETWLRSGLALQAPRCRTSRCGPENSPASLPCSEGIGSWDFFFRERGSKWLIDEQWHKGKERNSKLLKGWTTSCQDEQNPTSLEKLYQSLPLSKLHFKKMMQTWSKLMPPTLSQTRHLTKKSKKDGAKRSIAMLKELTQMNHSFQFHPKIFCQEKKETVNFKIQFSHCTWHTQRYGHGKIVRQCSEVCTSLSFLRSKIWGKVTRGYHATRTMRLQSRDGSDEILYKLSKLVKATFYLLAEARKMPAPPSQMPKKKKLWLILELQCTCWEKKIWAQMQRTSWRPMEKCKHSKKHKDTRFWIIRDCAITRWKVSRSIARKTLRISWMFFVSGSAGKSHDWQQTRKNYSQNPK